MMRRIVFFSAFFALFILCGCLSEDVMIREVGAAGRETYGDMNPASAMSNSSENLLQNLQLSEAFARDPGSVLLRLERLLERVSQDEVLCTMAELSMFYARSGVPADKAVSGYLSAVQYCQQYLGSFDRPMENPYSPVRLRMVRLSNLAQTELFVYLRSRRLLARSGFHLTTLTGRPVQFQTPDFRLPVSPDEVQDVKVCADFRPEKLTHISYQFGIGVPLIWSLQGKHKSWEELQVKSLETLPGTAVLLFSNDRKGGALSAKWYYLDVLQTETFELATGRSVPLEVDFTTPFAYMTRKTPLFNFIAYMLLPEKSRVMQGLYMTQPYDPERIPVVFVHGLMSNMRTWVQMINTLQNDPVIRKHFQFWMYTYSSGTPVLFSAASMRAALDRTVAECRKRYPENRLDQMVLVGHSMGGLLSKTMVQTGKGNLLSILLKEDTSFEELTKELTDADKDFVRNILEFEPRPYVKRVVFLAVPHRGASMATSAVGRLGANLIQLPGTLVTRSGEIMERMFRKKRALPVENGRLWTGIDNLDPDNPVLRGIMALPFREGIPYHSIIGNRKAADVPGGSDGVVPYASSHLDGAESEVVVRSGHSVHRELPAILELRRILHLHLRAMEKGKTVY